MRASLWGVAGLVVLTSLAYWPAYDAGFLWDDVEVYILENELVQAADGLQRIWSTRQAIDYYPLTFTSFWLEWQAWGDSPRGYHVVNVVLHVLNVLLVWGVLQQLRVPGAWVAAALFGLHPVNVESVAWISQRKNVLAGVFYFASIWAFVVYQDHGRRRYYYGALALFALTLLSKPSGVTLPFVLLGLAWWRQGRVSRADVIASLPFIGMAVALGLVTLVFQGRVTEGGHVYEGNFLSRIALAGRATLFYLQKAVFPAPLMLVYPRWPVSASPAAFVPLALLAAVAALLWRFRGRTRALCFALGYFVITLLPVLGLVDIGYMQFSFVADHWQYLSIVAVVAAIVASAVVAARRVRLLQEWVLPVVGVLGIVTLFVMTWKQAEIYKSEITAWRDTLAKNPNARVAHSRLGHEARLAGRTQEAVHHYRESVRISPEFSQGHGVLGTLYADMGLVQEATRHFEESLRLQPQIPALQANYGHFLANQRQFAAAKSHLRIALELDPEVASVHADLAYVLQELGEWDGAAQHYAEALQLDADSFDAAYNLGVAHTRQQRHRDAVAAYETAVRLRPDDLPARLALVDAYVAAHRLREAQNLARASLGLARARGNPEALKRLESVLSASTTPEGSSP